eukprot:TRINITY_DN1551_c0_g1_i1.p1 TRINITY_DN1551_c0_g1~~TRINITY_DN1551_c0_g1_i1.p1  ORF type:complete len:543 (-),score=148.07 TRINITY_DN1551_c0_g1_i1:264-1892(-)
MPPNNSATFDPVVVDAKENVKSKSYAEPKTVTLGPRYFDISLRLIVWTVASYFILTKAPIFVQPICWAFIAEVYMGILESRANRSPPKPFKKPAKYRSYTWEEVAEHNTEDDCWVSIAGKVYDITAWLPKHPGGDEHLLLCAGRDATDMFECYHPFTYKPHQILKKYEIGTLTSTQFPAFPEDTDGFYATLRERVGAYFELTGKDHKAPLAGLWRMAIVLSVAFVAYMTFNNPNSGALATVFAACIFGACQALPLLHIMHDASHTAIGHSDRWWQWVGRSLMNWFAGASMTSWHHSHVIGHHVYTNVMGVDPDMPMAERGDIRRLVFKQIWAHYYKYQHIYLPPLYGLLGLKTRVQDFTETFFGRRNGPLAVNPLPWATWISHFVSKSSWFIWRFLFPYWYMGMTWQRMLWVNFIAELCTGWYLAFNFQVSHISTDAEYPDADAGFKHNWAKHQVVTSVDYAHGDPLMTFLCGALNYQTVHHLFPSVSQYHYMDIAPIIVETCEEFGVKYNHLPHFKDAWGAHIDHLREMGEQGKVAHVHMD